MTAADIAEFRRRVALQRYHACVKKVSFDTEVEAQQAAEKLQSRRPGDVRPYLCIFEGDHWHVGNYSPRAVARARQALSLLLTIQREVQR